MLPFLVILLVLFINFTISLGHFTGILFAGIILAVLTLKLLELLAHVQIDFEKGKFVYREGIRHREFYGDDVIEIKTKTSGKGLNEMELKMNELVSVVLGKDYMSTVYIVLEDRRNIKITGLTLNEAREIRKMLASNYR